MSLNSIEVSNKDIETSVEIPSNIEYVNQDIKNLFFTLKSRFLYVFENYYGKDNVEIIPFKLEIPSSWNLNTLINTYSYSRDHLKTSYEFSELYETYKGVPLQDIPHEDFIKIYDYLKIFIYPTINTKVTIYFPKTRITNEEEQFIDIYDTFIRLSVTAAGYIQDMFEILRTTYTIGQYKRGYCHSHVCPGNLKEFSSRICLGNGPLKSLMAECSTQHPSRDKYLLFCRHLDLFLQTESLTGGPYIKLTDVIGNNSSNMLNYKHWDLDSSYFIGSRLNYVLLTFIGSDYVHKIIDRGYSFIRGYPSNLDMESSTISLKLSILQTVVLLSDLLLEWVEQNFSSGEKKKILDTLFVTATYKDGGFQKASLSQEDNIDFEGRSIEFKGRTIPFKIIPENNTEAEFTLIEPKVFSFLQRHLTLTLTNIFLNNEKKRKAFIIP